jgi:hypothetical protein
LFSSIMLLINAFSSSGVRKSSVGVLCATTPNRGRASLVSLPSSSSHCVLERAISAWIRS